MPVWNRTINLSATWKSDDPVEVKVKKIVEKIRKSGWLEETAYPDTLRDQLARVEQSTTYGEFDDAFSWIYDQADEDRVWIETHR